jgi:hypothetical protein
MRDGPAGALTPTGPECMSLPRSRITHVQARQRPVSPQPPSISDRISLLRLADQASRNVGSRLAAQAIREKWLTRELRVWVQWIPGHALARGPSGYVFAPLAEEPAPPSFLEHLEEHVPMPSSFSIEPEIYGLSFETIISASESGIYVGDGRSASLFVSRAEAAQFWPWVDDPPTEGDQRKAMQGRRSTRGAKTAWKWEDALIAASAHAYEHGLPEKQADLVSYVAEWFGDPSPGETQIKAHIAPLYRALARAGGR